MKKIINIIVFICILLNLSFASSFETKLKTLKIKLKKQNRLKSFSIKKLIELGNKIKENKSEQFIISKKLNNLSYQINIKEKQIKKSKLELFDLEKQDELLQKKIKNEKKMLYKYKKIFNKRLISIFKEKKKHIFLRKFFYFLNSNNLNEINKKYKFLNEFVKYDKKIVLDYKQSIESLKNLNKQLKLTQNKKVDVLNEYQSEIKKLQSLQKVFNDKLRQVIRNKKKLKNHIEYLKDRNKVLSAAIKNLEYAKKEIAEIIKLDKLNFKRKKGKLYWPIKKNRKNKILVSYMDKNKKYHFKYKIDGIEIKISNNQKIYSIAQGIVLFSGWLDSYGNTIIIGHDQKHMSLYSHLNELLVKKGEKVSTKTLIGYGGETASMYGYSLFFQIRVNSKPVDPIRWLRKF